MCQMQDILGQKIPTYHLDLIDDKALRQVFDKVISSSTPLA